MKKIPSIIALFCILLYIAAVLFGAYRVYQGINEQKTIAVQELNELAGHISRNSFLEPAGRQTLKDTIGACRVLEGIIITGSVGNEIVFEREEGKTIRWNGDNPGFIKRFGVINLPSKQVDVEGLRNVNIYSVYNTVNYTLFLEILKQTLVVILAALAAAFITLIFQPSGKAGKKAYKKVRGLDSGAKDEPSGNDFDFSGFEDRPPEKERGAFAGKDAFVDDGPADGGDFAVEDDFADGDDFTGDNGAFTAEDDIAGGGLVDDSFDNDDFTDGSGFADDAFTEEPENGKTPSAAKTGDDELPDFDDFFPGEPADDGETPGFADDFAGSNGSAGEDGFTNGDDLAGDDKENFALDDFVDEDTLSMPGEDSSGGPHGLYSPRSGAGWEQYTRDRLESELKRENGDLTLMTLECGKNVSCDDTLYKKFASEALEFFGVKDLVFEKGERGISVIIPGASLDEGMKKAGEFHLRVLKNLFGDFNDNGDLRIGISSRSGRDVNADRLLFEAAGSLEKTGSEESVVAFKVDPEKYREFMRRTSEKPD